MEYDKNMKKKIIFLTGTRADFGKLKILIGTIEKSSSFENYIFVTGMHTLSKYGSTYDEVMKQGYKNIFVFMNQTSITEMDMSLANTVTGFGNFVKEIKPDMIVVHGDRVEALAGAIVGSLNNILVSHMEGGEVSGTIDELIRHAVTKLSHIHFVANNEAKQRLIQMGELENSIFVIGSPDIEIMYSKNLPSITKAKKRYDIDFDKYSILIYHPVTTELEKIKDNINQVVSAVIDSNRNYVIIYPNNDAGSSIIFKEYERFCGNKNIKVFPSIRFEYFLTFLKNADFIMGNSSVGVRESEIYGVPSINIGNRQKGRSKSKNIIDVDENKNEIIRVMSEIENKKVKAVSNFGDGKSSKLFYELLSDEKIWKIAKQKQFVDIPMEKTK